MAVLPTNAMRQLPKQGDQVVDLNGRVELDPEIVKGLKATIMRLHELQCRPDRNYN